MNTASNSILLAGFNPIWATCYWYFFHLNILWFKMHVRHLYLQYKKSDDVLIIQPTFKATWLIKTNEIHWISPPKFITKPRFPSKTTSLIQLSKHVFVFHLFVIYGLTGFQWNRSKNGIHDTPFMYVRDGTFDRY